VPPSRLAQAVDRLTTIFTPLPDEAMDRPWAWQDYNEGLRVALLRTAEELRGLAVIVANDRVEAGSPRTQAQHILAQYHAAWRDLWALLAGVDDARLDTEPAPGRWSLRTTLGHMIRAEHGFLAVIDQALLQHHAGSMPAPIREDEWRALLAAEGAAVEQALHGTLAAIFDYHHALFDRVVEKLAVLPATELDVPSWFWEREPLPIRFRMHRFESHLRQHIIQVEQTLDAIGLAPTEARRLVRVVYQALAEVEGARIGAPNAGQDETADLVEVLEGRVQEMNALSA
jgi:uncharacterized damage-inducible protein DinB